MSECGIIDERGARISFTVPNDKVVNRMITFVDADGADVNVTGYTDIILRVETATPTTYTKIGGDITTANVNEMSLLFLCEIAVGVYDYTLNGVTATGERQLLYGKYKVV